MRSRLSTDWTGSPGLAKGMLLTTYSRPGRELSRIPGARDLPWTKAGISSPNRSSTVGMTSTAELRPLNTPGATPGA